MKPSLFYRFRVQLTVYIIFIGYWVAPKEMRIHIKTGVYVMYDEVRLFEDYGK